MKLAREIATVTYRSGPEWEQRFGRRRAQPSRPPALCPDFLIETYLDHAGEKWCLEYDPNSFLYISKAMDLFDLSKSHQAEIRDLRSQNSGRFDAFLKGKTPDDGHQSCSLTLPDEPYEEQDQPSQSPIPSTLEPTSEPGLDGAPPDLVAGLQPLVDTPMLVLGVAMDILFPSWQQKEIATALQRGGNNSVVHVELSEEASRFGHDTFLLDLENVGGSVKRFLDEA